MEPNCPGIRPLPQPLLPELSAPCFAPTTHPPRRLSDRQLPPARAVTRSAAPRPSSRRAKERELSLAGAGGRRRRGGAAASSAHLRRSAEAGAQQLLSPTARVKRYRAGGAQRRRLSSRMVIKSCQISNCTNLTGSTVNKGYGSKPPCARY